MIRTACFLLLISLLAFRLPGQDCAQLRAEAAAIAREKDALMEENARLWAALEAQAAQAPAEATELLAVPAFTQTQLIPVEAAGDCVEEQTNWSYVKRLRVFKRDSLDYVNGRLRKRLANPPQAPALTAADLPLGRGLLAAERVIFQQKTYAYCVIDPRQADLRLTFPAPQEAFGFATLADELAGEGKRLVMAMNAGMYQPDRRPVGLLVADGREYSPLNLKAGSGNFFLEPNAVFGLTAEGTPFLYPSALYARMEAAGRISPASLRLATQSGPLMVRGSKVNVNLTPNSPNRHFRNAVGIRANGEVVFVISEQKVCFYELADCMREALGCTDALYLDGQVSRLYLPALGREADLNDSRHLGPVFYLVE